MVEARTILDPAKSTSILTSLGAEEVSFGEKELRLEQATAMEDQSAPGILLKDQ